MLRRRQFHHVEEKHQKDRPPFVQSLDTTAGPRAIDQMIWLIIKFQDKRV